MNAPAPGASSTRQRLTAARRLGAKRRIVPPLQVVVTLGAAALFGLAYLLSDEFRAEVGAIAAILGRGDAEGLRHYILSYGLWAPVASLALMVVQALVAPVPSSLVSFANGLAFGVGWGWALSVAGHTLAAGVCFWLMRALGGGPVEAVVGRGWLESADRWFARWGTAAILITRLVPGVAFDAVSFAAGLTGIRFDRFLAATAIGVAPQTLLYAYLGHAAVQFIWIPLAITGLVVGGCALAAWWKRTRP